MKRNYKHNFLSILMLLALLLTSCGGTDAESDTIATAVAMTVSAQETQKAEATPTPKPTKAGPTSTPEAIEVTSTPTNASTTAPPTAPGPVGSGEPCLLANLVGETIPDGTVMQPGETFTKTWELENNGTCTWNSSYKIIYWSGDLMGGLSEYSFPEVVPPGKTGTVSIVLKAPSSNGNTTGYWKLQSEWGGQFGVGQYDQPFYVQINVNDAENPEYGVTNVTYTVTRDPATGCATNVWYRVHATITTNGPATVRYQWLQSDGNNTNPNPGPGRTLEFTEASSQTITREWSFHLGASPGTKWMQIIIHAPNYQEYPQATFVYDCQ
jgi:hypothetical protein